MELGKYMTSDFLATKVVHSREVREVVEGSTCISNIKLSEIC